MIRSFVLLSFMMSASVAVAETTSESAAAPAPAAKPAKERKICRSDASGTRLGKRICRTAKEWENERSEGDVDKEKQLGN